MEMDFEKICRTCLSGDCPLVSIFENNITDMSESESSSVIDLLTSLTDIKISTNDCLPSKICVPCMDELKISHLFRMKCKNSDMILRKALNENAKSNQISFIIPKLSNNKFQETIEMEISETLTSDSFQCDNLASISIKAETDDFNIDDDETKIEIIDEIELNSDKEYKISDDSESESESRTMGKAYLPPENITDTNFVCKCSFECTSAVEFTKHIRKFHIKGLTCMICKKAFGTKKNLIIHTKTHVIQWSVCPICGQKMRKSSMKMHLKCHEREKWIKCDQCEERFLKHSELRIHSIVHHAIHHKYKCDQCNIKFTSIELRDQHQETHNNKSRKHNCDLCSKVFTTSTKLTIHRRVHTGERPYKCEYCDKTFKQKCVMKTHAQIHTKVRPFQCPVCTGRFTTRNILMQHVSRLHRDEIEAVKTNSKLLY